MHFVAIRTHTPGNLSINCTQIWSKNKVHKRLNGVHVDNKLDFHSMISSCRKHRFTACLTKFPPHVVSSFLPLLLFLFSIFLATSSFLSTGLFFVPVIFSQSSVWDSGSHTQLHTKHIAWMFVYTSKRDASVCVCVWESEVSVKFPF